MTVTASRIGKSGLTLDWSGLASCAPRRSADLARLEAAHETLNRYFQNDQGGFYMAPQDPELHQESAVRDWASRALSTGATGLLFLGIGGSSLGPMAILHAWPSPLQVEFLESPDPTEWARVTATLEPSKTLIVIVSKSGGTFETMALASLALTWSGRSRWKTHVVAITDPVRGDLCSFAKAEGIPILPIAPSIGGRYSVFSPVGLIALALAGRDTRAFLEGAESVRNYVDKTPLTKNAFALMADLVLSMKETHSTHTFMAYGARLRLLPRWWVQMWSESLGKNGLGFSPIGAVGPEDQHSLLQLLRDGPNRTITFFLTCDDWQTPETPIKGLRPDKGLMPPVFGVLEGRTLSDLLRVEADATAKVLAKQNRPHLILRMDRFHEFSLGSFFWAWSYVTALTGAMMGVNPFDQPGVEEGKQFITEGLRAIGGRGLGSESSPAADAEAERAANAVERLRDRVASQNSANNSSDPEDRN